jgi:hypothetical protein
VDPLGHVFIYTATALRLLRKCDPSHRRGVLLAMAEYLGRNATVDEPTLLDDDRPVEELLPRAFERINILGHNVIYAAELKISLPRVEPRLRRHLVGQLARNVQENDCDLSYDQYCSQRQYEGCVEDWRTCLERAFAEGDPARGFAAVAEACVPEAGVPALRQALITLFARIQTLQPHYLIYPAATCALTDHVDSRVGELAFAQLVKMGVEAAAEHGLADAAAQPHAETPR